MPDWRRERARRVLPSHNPAGVIDWGSGDWYLAGPWEAFTTNSVSFVNSQLASAPLTFPTPKKVVSIKAYHGGVPASTVTLSCPGLPTVTATVQPGAAPVTITTGWTAPCGTLNVTSSDGWWTNFDDLVYQDQTLVGQLQVHQVRPPGRWRAESAARPGYAAHSCPLSTPP